MGVAIESVHSVHFEQQVNRLQPKSHTFNKCKEFEQVRNKIVAHFLHTSCALLCTPLFRL